MLAFPAKVPPNTEISAAALDVVVKFVNEYVPAESMVMVGKEQLAPSKTSSDHAK